MPSKQDASKAAAIKDPMVPIIGKRVDASLRFAGVSQVDVAKHANVTRQAIGLIVSGQSKKCRRSIRRAIADLCGSPITVRYLGGKEDLDPVRLIWPPSAVHGDIRMPYGVVEEALPVSWAEGMPPAWEIIALTIGDAVTQALAAEGRPQRIPFPNMKNAVRWLLSLSFWREFLFDDQRVGATVREMKEQSAEFADHLGEALQVLLRPWFEGTVTTRRYLLRRIVFGLDLIALTNEEIATERNEGRFADLAIRDELNGHISLTHQEADERRRMFAAEREAYRQAGLSEAEIAKAIVIGNPQS